MPSATQQWIAGLDQKLRSRLRDLELLAPSNGDGITVGDWTAEYVRKRTDLKERTLVKLMHARTSLMEFLDPDIPVVDFTAGHADDFRLFLLRKGLAEATVRRRCKRAKQFFSAAVKRGYITKNPFVDVPTSNVANESRRVFVERDTIAKVIAACPNDQWRLIFALARYGGLRIPSEIQGLRWSDIDWTKKQFRVHSPKTEHIEGKEHRDVPLFPELVPYFKSWKAQRKKGEALVFPALAKRGNLRQYAHSIIRKAGIEPWTRVYQNLRASRETELVEDFPVHVVTAWLGNSPDTAAKHYLSVLKTHLERAVGCGSPSRGTDMGHTMAVRGCQTTTDENGDSSQVLDAAEDDTECHLEAICGKSQLVPRRGLEPPTYRFRFVTVSSLPGLSLHHVLFRM
jgi:integrase